MMKVPEEAPEQFRFSGVMEQMPDKGKFHIVRVPQWVSDTLGVRGVVRVEGTMNGVTIDRGLLPDGDGGHYIVLSGDLRKAARLKLGYEAQFELHLHHYPDDVAVPEELLQVFEQDPASAAAFERFTPGFRRSILSWITSAKRDETRIKRAVILGQRFAEGYYRKYER